MMYVTNSNAKSDWKIGEKCFTVKTVETPHLIAGRIESLHENNTATVKQADGYRTIVPLNWLFNKRREAYDAMQMYIACVRSARNTIIDFTKTSPLIGATANAIAVSALRNAVTRIL